MGRDEGREEAKREVAINMADDGVSMDDISRYLKVDIEQVRKWVSD